MLLTLAETKLNHAERDARTLPEALLGSAGIATQPRGVPSGCVKIAMENGHRHGKFSQ